MSMMTMQKTDVYHLLPTYHVYMEVSQVLGIRVFISLELSFGALIPIHFSMGNKAESQTTPYVSKLLWYTAQTWLCYRPFTNPNTNIIPSPPSTHTHTHTHTKSNTCRYILPLWKMTKMRNPNSPKRAHNAPVFKDKCLKKVDGQTC